MSFAPNASITTYGRYYVKVIIAGIMPSTIKTKKRTAKRFQIEIEPILDGGGDEGDAKEANVYVLIKKRGAANPVKAVISWSQLLEFIKGHGFSLDWKYNSNKRDNDPKGRSYVRVKSKLRAREETPDTPEYVQVSWLLKDIWPQDKKEIEYANGKRTDLRDANLRPVPAGTAQQKRKAKSKAA